MHGACRYDGKQEAKIRTNKHVLFICMSFNLFLVHDKCIYYFEIFMKILFVDEPDEFRYCWCDVRIFSKHNFSRDYVMIRAGFSSFGQIRLFFVTSKTNKDNYQNVCQEHLISLRNF